MFTGLVRVTFTGERSKVILREYLYVDFDRVRGMLAQIDDGVPESSRTTEEHGRHAELRNRLIGGVGSKNSDEHAVEKSMADSLFSILEHDLEALGFLQDLSHQLSQLSGWTDPAKIKPGALIRLTGPAILFHPDQVIAALVGVSIAADGMSKFITDEESTDLIARLQEKKARPKPTKTRPAASSDDRTRRPEDDLPSVEHIPYMNMPREQVAGLIQFTRGVYSDGVHFVMRPLGAGGPSAIARLEAGRRYFDSSPEVLLSRFGLDEQEWTIVGTIGTLGPEADNTSETTEGSATTLNRNTMTDLLTAILREAAKGGLIDSPLKPGFTLVPLAVYRSISNAADDMH